MRSRAGKRILLGCLLAAAAPGARAAPEAAPAAEPTGYQIDRNKRELLIPCKIAPRKLPNLTEIYPIEVIATWPAPRGQKAHETVVTVDVKPEDIHKALEWFGLKPGKPARGDDTPTGPALEIFLDLPEKAGAQPPPGARAATKRVRIESLLVDRRNGRPLPPTTWHFTGSSARQPDPTKPDTVYGAGLSGTLIGLFPVTDELVIQSGYTAREEALLKVETAKDLLPPEGSPATLVIRIVPPGAKPQPAAAARPSDEASILNLMHRLAVTPARPVRVELPPMPPTSVPDPERHRRDLPPDPPAPDEAHPVPLPLPPVPPAPK